MKKVREKVEIKEKALLKTKKEILRLTALSYSMVMISISDLFAKKDKGLEILKEFELIKTSLNCDRVQAIPQDDT
mgnify:CR=1 FL=1